MIHTLGFWKYVYCPVAFVLVVENFGIKYKGNQHLCHLLNAIRKETYMVEVDCTDGLYCGIKLDLTYVGNYIDISMPGYVQK